MNQLGQEYGMMYGIYERMNGTIYFSELTERLETKMKQHADMVDILIYEKRKALNMAAPPYIPEERKTVTHTQQDVQSDAT